MQVSKTDRLFHLIAIRQNPCFTLKVINDFCHKLIFASATKHGYSIRFTRIISCASHFKFCGFIRWACLLWDWWKYSACKSIDQNNTMKVEARLIKFFFHCGTAKLFATRNNKKSITFPLFRCCVRIVYNKINKINCNRLKEHIGKFNAFLHSNDFNIWLKKRLDTNKYLGKTLSAASKINNPCVTRRDMNLNVPGWLPGRRLMPMCISLMPSAWYRKVPFSCLVNFNYFFKGVKFKAWYSCSMGSMQQPKTPKTQTHCLKWRARSYEGLQRDTVTWAQMQRLWKWNLAACLLNSSTYKTLTPT